MIIKIKKKALFVGRFQPCTLAHQWLFETKLSQGIPILIAIRDVEPDEKNPLTAKQSAYLIRKVYEGKDVEVIIIPDIESINWGRGVGYSTTEHTPPDGIKEISATYIRESIKKEDGSWKQFVNTIIHEDVENYFKK